MDQPWITLAVGLLVAAVAGLLGALWARWRLRGTSAAGGRVLQDRVRQAEAKADAVEAKLRQDALTGLSSRAHFMATLADGTRTRGYALAVIDIDSFKSINDTYGHGIGDRLLQRVADAMRGALPGDALLARLGGDEFVVALPTETPEDALSHLNAMREAVAGTEIASSWKQVRRSISAGLTMLPDNLRLEDAISEADTALYAAKEGGRNRVVMVDGPLRTRHRAAMSEPTLEQMREGVENSEFTYFVQPIYSLTTGQPIGVEALIRWVTSDGTVRLPGEFMHLFTSQYNGTLKPPLDAANAVAATFAQSGSDTFCAFNISTAFLKRSFDPSDAWLDDLLMGIDPKRVVFEITETAGIDNTTAARQMLGFLRERGVRIALDDFGTGHSNLSRLLDLPIDIVKVDRHFVSRLPGNRRNRAIVGALLSLGHELGFEVIAEGIETQQQLEALAELGVNMAQGYHLARPQTIDDWLGTQHLPHTAIAALVRRDGTRFRA